MKKVLLTLVVLLISLPLVQAQDLTEKGATTLSSEEQAVKQVIEDETKYFNLRDYEKWSDCVAKDPMTVYSWTTPFRGENSVFEAKGWEEVSAKMKHFIETQPVNENLPKKYDYQFKVAGDMAYVNFLEGDGTHETRVLEKRDGKWKILRMEATASKSFKAMQKKYALQRFAGNWKLDPSTILIEGEGTWKLLSSEVQSKTTNTGLKAHVALRFLNPQGEEVVIEEDNLLSYDLGTGKVAMMQSTYFPKTGWSEGSLGTGEVDDEGVFRFEAHRVGEETMTKGKMKFTDNGDLYYSVKRLNEKGEQVFKISYTMVEEKPATAMKP